MSFDFDQVIDRRATRSLKWTRYGSDVLPMWVADMDFAAPEPAREALRAALEHGVFGYEMPTARLAETVVARMERLYGWRLSPDAVVPTPGIVAGFNVAGRAVCRHGEGVLIQTPVYRPFFDVPEHSAGVLQSAPLAPIPGKTVRYEINWQAFEAGFHSNNARTAMFLLCHPHNPIGRVCSRPELERMAEICLRHEVVICSDEIHSELLLGGARHVPLGALAPEIAQRSITLVSASKTFNLVGLFCGFALIPDPVTRASFRKVLHQSAMHVNSLGLIAAEAAFSGVCDSWLEALRAYLTANRDYLVDFVNRELPGVRVSVPDATYLAWLDFGGLAQLNGIGTDVSKFLLKQGKVALNPGTEFGPGGEGFVRLNFGCPWSTLKEGLERIKSAVFC